ncbi:NAD-dependent epimerase/dehydratase family protein [Roseivivax sp.]
MKVALTGAGGVVGGLIAAALAARGDSILRLGGPDWQLGGPAPDFGGAEALVHCAFHHAPGRFRGGDAGDPEGFRAKNHSGSRALFEAAVDAGVTRILFLSSRAVFDGYPRGTRLTEDLPPRPAEIYGEVKAGAEAALAALPVSSVALRATGVYGPGPANKWRGLIADYLAGRAVAPRIGTEVHGADLAEAVALLLDAPGVTGPVHCSDLLLDRRALLAEVASLTGAAHPLPAATADAPGVLDCARLAELGWRPGGMERLRADLPAMIAEARAG